MKSKFTLRFILCVYMLAFSISITKAQSPNPDSSVSGTNMLKSAAEDNPYEKGYTDFPFTLNGITVSLTTSGSTTSYGASWSDCGGTVLTKAGSIWIGAAGSPGSITNTFSSPANNITYNITAANNGEVITVTTSDGTPSVSVTEGCSYSSENNTISFTGSDVGAIITITSTSPFTWVQISHNGSGVGSLITLDASSLAGDAVPVNRWAIIAVFLIIGILIVFRSRQSLLKN